MIREYTATLSAVDPADDVIRREFHQFDGQQNEIRMILDPADTTVTGSIDDGFGNGSCYLIDYNAAGPSDPSPAVALVPDSPPPPPPAGVPKAPTVLAVDWGQPQPGRR